jgi:CheY-like chemotaxis protein
MNSVPQAPTDAYAAAAGPVLGPVLLVEDHPVNQMIALEMLKALGLEVLTADDGAQALERCEATPPRLVLMDLQMPVMDGLQATRRLREMQQQGRLPGFPILALTAHALASDREMALAAGMDDYLTKPIVFETLRRALARWLPELPAG